MPAIKSRIINGHFMLISTIYLSHQQDSHMCYKVYLRLCFVFLPFIFLGCQSAKTKGNDTLFTSLSSSHTGIDFENKLTYDKEFNIYTYRNFYNGGGVAIGDVNNDGLPDIFFTANMLPNRLYLNKGNFQFEDITAKAGIVKRSKWSTGPERTLCIKGAYSCKTRLH